MAGHRVVRAIIALGLAAPAGLGACQPLECGAGTYEANRACLPEEVEHTSDPPDEDPTIDDVIAALSQCAPAEGNGRLDIPAGCADGACASMTYVQWNDALSEVGPCRRLGETDEYLYCSWSVGIWSTFDDVDLDDVPDADTPAGTVFVDEEYEGTTNAGTGMLVEMRCFIDEFGAPDSVDFARREDGTWAPSGMFFSAIGLSVSDNWAWPVVNWGPTVSTEEQANRSQSPTRRLR